ncbi:MAG: DUF1080 domain-containing protein [Thermoguttaceae bacterium]|jgi:hypothetical protein
MQRDLCPRTFNVGRWKGLLAACGLAIAVSTLACGAEYFPPVVWPQPPIIEPGAGGGPPSDAVVLFDGKDMSAWADADKWTVQENYVVSGGHDIHTKQTFGDCQLHVEWATPEKVVGSGQGRGNSGVFMMGLYEIQILDSYDNDTYYDGQAAAIYKQHPPMVNCCRKPGQWQTYDILWEAPRFDAAGKLLKPACVTVLQNGVVVQNHFELTGLTSWDQKPRYTPQPAKGPVGLQFHGNPVRFRNIWIREMKDIQSHPGTHAHHPG